jgi:hypothetical protein
MPNDNAARSTSKPDRSPEHTAGRYVERLQGHRSPADAAKRQRYLKSRAGDGDVVIGVRMKHVFELSKEFKEMPLGEIEELLESRIHEVRAGGVKIMAYQAASTTTPEGRRRELFELYLCIHRTWGIGWWPRVAGPSSAGGCCRRCWWCRSAGLGAVLAGALPGGAAAPDRGAARSGSVGIVASAGEVVAVSRPGAAGCGAVAGAVCRHGPAAGYAVYARSVLAGPAAGGGGRLVLGRGRHASQRQGPRPSRHPPARGWRGGLRRCAWRHWWSAAPTRWSMPSWTAAGWARSRWRCGWPARPGPGMLVLPRSGVPRGAAVACRGRHRGVPAVAGAGQPGAGRRAGAAGRVLAACAGTRPATGLPGRSRSGFGWSPTPFADPGRTGAGPYRLVTDLLDHQRYPADRAGRAVRRAVGGGDHARRDQDHQRGPGVVLTSKTPTASASRSGPICWSTTPPARAGVPDRADRRGGLRPALLHRHPARRPAQRHRLAGCGFPLSAW